MNQETDVWQILGSRYLWKTKSPHSVHSPLDNLTVDWLCIHHCAVVYSPSLFPEEFRHYPKSVSKVHKEALIQFRIFAIAERYLSLKPPERRQTSEITT